MAVGAEPLVGGPIRGRRAEVEAHPAEEARVVGDVRVEENGERLRRRREGTARRGVRVPALAPGRPVEPVEARRGRDEEDGLVRPLHLESALRRRPHGSAAHRGLHDRGETHPLGARALVVADGRLRLAEVARVDVARGPAAQRDRVGALGLRGVAQLAAEPGRERDLPGAVRAHAEDDDLVGEAREHLAGVERAVGPERRGGDRAVEVELAAVALDLSANVEVQEQVPERLVGLVVRPLHLLRESVGLGVASREDGLAHLREPALRVGVVPVRRPARPQRVLVEGQPLLERVPEHHRPEPAVPDRQRLDPGGRGLLVPEAQRRLGGECRAGGGGQEDGGEKWRSGACHGRERTPAPRCAPVRRDVRPRRPTRRPRAGPGRCRGR